MRIHGLKNCDSCRKAMKWARDRGVEATLVDVRDPGLSSMQIAEFATAVGWESLLNRRSTTWKQLGPAETASVDRSRALRLIAKHPTLMNRPVIVFSDKVLVGFDKNVEATLEKMLSPNPNP